MLFIFFIIIIFIIESNKYRLFSNQEICCIQEIWKNEYYGRF